MLTNPIDHLAQITDPRRQNRNLLHPLKNILTIALRTCSRLKNMLG